VNAIISTTEDCVFAVNIRKSNLILAPSQECKSEAALPDTSKYYALDKCHQRQPHDEWDYVQVKPYHNQNHVYCSGSNITIGKVTARCPDQTFILPETADFQINDHYYRVGEFRLNHQEVIDPLFTLRTNWHLQPKLHMDHILESLDQDDTETFVKEDESQEPSSIWHYVSLVLGGCVIVLMLILIVALVFYCKKKEEANPAVVPAIRMNPIVMEI
jgi:hypothetical protein